MRILIISTFFPPLNSIASLRPYSWAKYWAQAGHDVTVLTTAKEEDKAIALKLPAGKYRVVEVPMPALFSRLKRGGGGSSKTNKRSVLSRLVDHLRFKKGVFNAARMPDFTDLWAIKAYRVIRQEQNWDLVISTAGPYSVHLIADRLKKNGKAAQWIADYRDTWSNNYIYPGIFPFNWIEGILEKRLLMRCDAVTTVSVPFAESFRRQFGCQKVAAIENGFDPADLEGVDAASYFPADGKFRIVHTGSIYLGKRDPTPLFEAIRRIEADPKRAQLLDKLEVLFVGPRQANLEELIEKLGVGKWVKLHGFVSREDALRIQRDAQALLFLAWNDPSVDGVLTGKIFEYLYAKTPIIAVGAPEIEASQRLILEARAGRALRSVDAVEEYLTDRLKAGRAEELPYDDEVLSRYNRKMLADKMLTMVEQ